MSYSKLTQAADMIDTLKSDDPSVQQSLKALQEVISVGNISGATGVAIGRNIRVVINHFNLSAEQVAQLLDLRTALIGLNPEKYKLVNLLTDKTRDFVGRQYVFEAIAKFLDQYPSGYLFIEGEPGLGKSAFLAEYIWRTGCISHFNVRSQGIVSTAQFLESVCSQLIADYGLPYAALPANATQDGSFLEKLLREASAKLEPNERLVIAIDALDEAEQSSSSGCGNPLCLPATLPDRVYFILTKRPVKIPFVAQTFQNTLNLMDHGSENRADVELYLRYNVERPKLRIWIQRQADLTPEVFVTQLADLSANNFMYLRYVLPEIEEGGYQNLSLDRLPVGLTGYYEEHWRRMGMMAEPLPELKIMTVYILSEVHEPVSLRMIADILKHNKLEVSPIKAQSILSEWRQFLHEDRTAQEPRYSVYHASFRDFLNRQDIVQAAGITIRGVNELIANYLWAELFGDNPA